MYLSPAIKGNTYLVISSICVIVTLSLLYLTLYRSCFFSFIVVVYLTHTALTAIQLPYNNKINIGETNI